MDKAIRYNAGKPRWSLVDHKSLEPLVRVLEFGENKYGRFNWKKGLDKTEILESLYRHLISLMDGQEFDEETGLHHIGHIMSNAMFYSYFMEEKKVLKGNMIMGGQLRPLDYNLKSTSEEEINERK